MSKVPFDFSVYTKRRDSSSLHRKKMPILLESRHGLRTCVSDKEKNFRQLCSNLPNMLKYNVYPSKSATTNKKRLRFDYITKETVKKSKASINQERNESISTKYDLSEFSTPIIQTWNYYLFQYYIAWVL